MNQKLEKVIDKLIEMTKRKRLIWNCISDSSKSYKIYKTSYVLWDRDRQVEWNIKIYKAVGTFVSLVDRQDNKLFDFPADLVNLNELYLAVARESFDIDNFIETILKDEGN